MTQPEILQSAILNELASNGPCLLQTRIDRLSHFPLSEVFAAIDQLSRDGDLVLNHPFRRLEMGDEV